MKRKRIWVALFALLLGSIAIFLRPASDPAEANRVSFEGAQPSMVADEGGAREAFVETPSAANVPVERDRMPPVDPASGVDSPLVPMDAGDTDRAEHANVSLPQASVSRSGKGSDEKRTEEPVRSAADILAEADMQNPAVREHVVAQLRELSEKRRANAETRADSLGIPVRMETPEGQVVELQGFDGDRPLYYTTQNRNAAISAAVPALYASPYVVTGQQVSVGVWDAGSVRSTHQELSGRVKLLNSGAALDDHATHVAGTIAASGIQVQAKGMAPAAVIYSLDWNNDLAEMALAGAATPDDTERIPVSNHSYGLITGYMQVSGTSWRWFGQGQSAQDVDPNFGRYHSSTRDWDALAYSLPHYSIFQSAGNDRLDNPSAGHRVDNPYGLFLFTYDPSVHPKGDGVYHGGYETISYAALAKNVITVGAVEDAVSGDVRTLAAAGMSTFASWGPADDGRIKPDLVANGVGLYSSLAQGDTAYGTYSGTSMATPSAAGAAALLVNLYQREFSGRLMAASLLKGLLIQTADDLGTLGPDYRYGWGLINVERAAALMMDHLQNAGSPRLITGDITIASPAFSHSFEIEGTEPVRVTLCWTDPAGTQQTAHDSRVPVLVHDLNLVVVGPDGHRYLPYVMPFVGAWTASSMSLSATRGTNHVDNVEQVLIENPALPGSYTIEISLSGALTRSSQPFSLVVSGAAAASGETRVLDLQGDLNFGSLAVGTTFSRIMTIRNIGNAPLGVTGLETPAAFSAVWSGIVAPGAGQEVTVQFSPSQAISYDGQLRVLSDASAGADTLPLSGRGVQDILSLTNGVPVPGLFASQGNEQYFVLTVPAGQERLDISIAGGNGGDADLYVRHGQLPTTSQWDYRPYLTGSDETVGVDNPASGDWYIMVRAYTAYTNVTLTATCTPPVTPTRILRLSGTLAYGNIPVGDRVVRTVTLRNDGSEALVVTGIQLPVGFEGAWAGNIPSGASQEVDIAFVPLLEQTYTGQLTVSSDKTSGDEGLPVSGNGVSNYIPLQNGVEVGPFNGVISSTTFFYIDVPAGQHLLEVRLDGGVGVPDLYVRQGTAPSLDVFDYYASAGDPRVLQIIDPASDRWFVMLHGVVQYSGARLVVRYETVDGVERVIRLAPPLDFGVLRVNETAIRAFDIHNDGTAPLNVSRITYPDGFTGAASVSIPSGGVHQVQVAFSPTAPGLYDGVLTVQSDATSGDASLSLAGQAVDLNTPIPLQNGVPVTDLTGTIGSVRYYVIDVPTQADELNISMSGGTGDADLYVRYGAIPTLVDWDYRPYRFGNNETVQMTAPNAGAWYIMIHGWRAYEGASLVASYTGGDQGVYRFWSPLLKGHFYTISRTERDHIIATWPDVWNYEGVAFYAHAGPVAGTSPVYRFWSPVYGKHFFTISEAEKNHIQATWPNVWSYEGIAWYAYSSAGAGRSPVYRFWSPVNSAHFFTISEAERDHIMATWPDIWRYEGIAYYVFASAQVSAPSRASVSAVEPKGTPTVDRKDDSPSLTITPFVSVSGVAGPVGMGLTGRLPAETTFGLSCGDSEELSAMLYDSVATNFMQLLPPTLAPRQLVVPPLTFGQRYWLSVLARDIAEEEWTLAYGGWLGRVADVPEAEITTVDGQLDSPLDLPVEHIVLPETDEPLVLRLYDRADNSLIKTVTGLKGGTTYELSVPAWNQWYRLEIGDEASGVVLQTLWIGHQRTH